MTVPPTPSARGGQRTIAGALVGLLLLLVLTLHSPRPLPSEGIRMLRTVTAPKAPCEPSSILDFIEIGTSDFGTELQRAITLATADGRPRRGLSVEAVHLYLDRLPSVPGLEKVNAAVSGASPHDATVPVFYIEPRDIDAYFASDALPTWLRGCNSVGAPHPQALKELGSRGLMRILKNMPVPVLSIREVLEAHEGCRTLNLKLDVEGLDAQLLLGYVDFLWHHPECWAEKITFESKLIEPLHVRSAVAALAGVGYSECGVSSDAGGGEDDTVLCYDVTRDARIVWAGRGAGVNPSLPADMLDTILGGSTVGLTEAREQHAAMKAAANALLGPAVCPWRHDEKRH